MSMSVGGIRDGDQQDGGQQGSDRDGDREPFTLIGGTLAEPTSLKLIATALNHINDMVVITEAYPLEFPGPRIVYVNPAFERHTGYRREEVLGKTPRILQGPLTQQQGLDRLRAALHQLQPIRVELINYTKAGKPFWLELDVTPLANESGEVTHWVAVQRDITERKQTEVALRESETRFHRLLQLVPNVAVQSYYPDGTVHYWNQASEVLYGYSEQEALGGNLLELIIPPELRPGVAAAMTHMAATGEPPTNGELTLMRKDGSRVCVYSSHGVVQRDGYPPEVFCIDIDLTEQKQAEAALRLSEERFRLLSKATADAVWDWNLVTGEFWWGEGLEALFGYAIGPEQSTVDFCLSQVHPDDKAAVEASVQQAIDGTATEWESQYRFRCHDGRYATVSDRGFIIRNGEGTAIRMVGGMTDISDRILLEERLHQSQRLESLGQLTGGVAHDFNNLLTVVLGNAELLGELLTEQPQLQALAGMIGKAAHRGAELTQQLLAFARRQTLAPTAVDVNPLIAALAKLLDRTLGEQIEVRCRCDPTLWPALVDPGQLESALLNLCLNARDAMAGGGQLILETSTVHLDQDYTQHQEAVLPGDYVMITISDTGTGIEPQVLEQVFEPFFTTKEAGKGTGLGLSMVYGFVCQSNGHIKIYSELGIGTTIKLYLPRCEFPGTDPAVPTVTAPLCTQGSELILLVEDNPLVRHYAQEQLASLGYRVLAVENGPQALRVIQQRQDIDLLFTDVMLPGGIDGRQLVAAADQLRPGLKVLYTSGYSENVIVHQGRLDAGIQLLRKPYRRQELAQHIRQALT